MDLEEFRSAHPVKPPQPAKKVEVEVYQNPAKGGEHKMVSMGPSRKPPSLLQRMSNLKAGLCPICDAMVKEVPPASKMDHHIVFYVCVENKHHRFSQVELERMEPTQIQKDAWSRM